MYVLNFGTFVLNLGIFVPNCCTWVIATLGLVGNIVILYAILSKKGMRTARNYFILCLAFSDLLLCAFTMPLTLWEVLRQVYLKIVPALEYRAIRLLYNRVPAILSILSKIPAFKIF